MAGTDDALERESPRQHTEQGKERKQQLVEAAMELFAERGYAATRIADICDAAGVAKGLFYWYFPTKHDLFAELVRIDAPAAAPGPGRRHGPRRRRPHPHPPGHRGERAVHGRARRRTSPCSRSSAPIRDSPTRCAKGATSTSDDVLAHVREAQRDGQIADADPALLALGVLGAVSSFTNAWRNGRIDTAADELAAFVGDWVVSA